ncbi:PREDICTED: uncharacterized protein LOC101295213 [Fragaria vesca subsp. vesca]|uniref:uncharacterized protein LOC101295213 n=1 Tax=Fragaria vesca subsp. vesca TaxID=101020 RepID=UPI0002C3424B|nr:PREDICTED: uncharacterized protein LOC101295213 [Fragaria vesca subsp. vesca]
MRDVAKYDPYFVQGRDATGTVGLSTEQKLTCAMRQLTYGVTSDFFDDYMDIAKSTAIEILEHFIREIWNVYHEHYLRRPTPADLRRLLDKAAERGFPGIIGSLDCSLNDINVLGQSPLFNDVSRGETPQVSDEVQNRHYGQCYYLVDDIYPKWSAFVQAIKNPRTSQTKHFTRMQEAYRKDVERAFGILQARWVIITGPTRGWSNENLQFIMMTCIILYNMIVEDEHDEDAAEPFDPNDILTIPKKAHIYDRILDQDTSVHRNPNMLNQFMHRYWEVRCPVMNKNLKDDLFNHMWSMKLQADENDQ